MLLIILPTGATYNNIYFGDVNDPIHLTNPGCYGSEHRITDCWYNNNTVGYSHIEDWSVICNIGQYSCHYFTNKAGMVVYATIKV